MVKPRFASTVCRQPLRLRAAVLLLAMTGALGPLGATGAVEASPPEPGAAVAVPPLPSAEAIESLSDADLTALSVHWSQLSAEQRRSLLNTVRSRMQRQKQAASAASPLQSQRRYGRVVRKRDGSVVSIETRVYQSADGRQGRISHRMTFGAGFERRQQTAEAEGSPGMPVAGSAESTTPASGTGNPAAEAVPETAMTELNRAGIRTVATGTGADRTAAGGKPAGTATAPRQ